MLNMLNTINIILSSISQVKLTNKEHAIFRIPM